MSTLLVAAIVIGAVAGVCMLLVRIDNKQKQRTTNDLLKHFHLLCSDHNLNISSQEVLTGGVIGLDGVHRKLAVLQKQAETVFDSDVFDLNEIKSCFVKRHYGTIGSVESRDKKTEQYLEKILLHFEFNDRNEPLEVKFYNHIDHVIYQIAELEAKAKHWELILSKMLVPVKKRA